MRFRQRNRNHQKREGVAVPQVLASHLHFETDTGLLEIARTTARSSFPEWSEAERENVAQRAAMAAGGHLEREAQIDAMEAVFVAAEFDRVEDQVDGSDESLMELGW